MIKIKELSKKYGTLTALDGVSLEIEKGKVYGLLGPNGAGKSTLMNIISGVICGQGSVEVDGADVFSDPRRAKAKIGYLPEQPPVYGSLTVTEYLSFVIKAKGLRGELCEAELTEVLESTGLTSVKDRVISGLSKGYTQRVGIAAALAGDSEYVILDEPTVGLDPIEIQRIRSLIRRLAEGRTVILSSHILAEVQLLCDELIIINAGRIAACGSKDEVIRTLGGERRVELTVRGGVSLEDLKGTAGVTGGKVEGRGAYNRFVFTTDGMDVREELSRRVAEKGALVCELTVREPSLEEVFVNIIMSEEEK